MKKGLAIFLSIIILITTFYAVNYLAKNCNHEHHDYSSSCDICINIEKAKQITTRICFSIILTLLSFLSVVLLNEKSEYGNILVNDYTLVKQKVRLDN